MSDLADLLELLHGADARWQTAALRVRRWRDSELGRTAMRRYAEALSPGGINASAYAGSSGDDRVSTCETTTTAWVDRLGDRFRIETSRTDGESLTVRVGSLRWSYSPGCGSRSNEQDADVRGPRGGDFQWMLEPSSLLPALDFSVIGTTEVSGRLAVEAIARPRAPDPRHGLGAQVANGADEMILAVDRHRGVVLRAEARLDGRPFHLQQITELVFDEDLGDDLFVFVSPDGSPARSPRDAFARHQPVQLEEATRRASFTVLVPTLLPHGWTMTASYALPRDRPPDGDYVVLRVRAEHSMETRMLIHESGEATVDHLEWEPVEREGHRIAVWRHQPSGRTCDAKTEVGGTHVRVNSTLDRDTVLDIVSSLRPAPREVPRLRPR